MNQFWCSVLSCSDLDNQKQSRITNLLQVLRWMLTLEIFDANCQSVIMLLACLLVTSIPQICHILKIQVGIFIPGFCPRCWLKYHDRLSGHMKELKRKTKKQTNQPNKNSQKPTNQKKTKNTHIVLLHNKQLNKFTLRSTYSWCLTERCQWGEPSIWHKLFSVSLSICNIGKTTSLSHKSHVKRLERDQQLRYQVTFYYKVAFYSLADAIAK